MVIYLCPLFINIGTLANFINPLEWVDCDFVPWNLLFWYSVHFWYDALKALPVAQIGAFLYLEPIVTVIVALIVLSEALLVASAIGGGNDTNRSVACKPSK